MTSNTHNKPITIEYEHSDYIRNFWLIGEGVRHVEIHPTKNSNFRDYVQSIYGKCEFKELNNDRRSEENEI